ncbi:MAG: putative Ig domain-containing protein, partial [Acidiferrobacterales bacterium]
MKICNIISLLATSMVLAFSTTYANYPEGGDGDVTFEAEHYHSSTPQGGNEWLCNASSTVTGYLGDGALWASPEDTTRHWSKFYDPTAPLLDTVSPRIDYLVNFGRTGTYHVWMRVWAPGLGSDSWHVGIDGTEVFNAAYMIDKNKTFGAYVWVNTRQDSGQATLDITTPGVHSINLWMRESGVYIDRIHLVDVTIHPTWDPTDPSFIDPNDILSGFIEPTADVPTDFATLPLNSTAAVPIIQPDSGPIDSPPDKVTLSVCSSNNGATVPDIYYTIGNPSGAVPDPTPDLTTEPTTIDYSVGGPITIPVDDTEVRAIASVFPAGTLSDSVVVSKVFNVTQFPVFVGPNIADMPGLIQGTPIADVNVFTLFNDSDGDLLTFTISGRPLPGSGLSIDPVTAIIGGTPTQTDADASPINLTVVATDPEGAFATSNVFTVTVADVNLAPTVANPIPDQSAAEDASFSFAFAANTFDDIDGDTLTYSSTLVGGGSLPGWLSFAGATRTFSGTPANADVGTISVEVTADDLNGGTVTDQFDITITNTNDAPTVANPVPDQSAAEDASFSFAFAANTFDDIDGDTLTYSSTLVGGGSLPGWLSFAGATRTFNGTP